MEKDICLIKPITNRNYNFVMAYPETEEFALSSLGYMWLYKIASETEGINAIRISTDNVNINSKNIESIAFSLSFDFDFMGVFSIMDKLDIPILKKDRTDEHPIIFAGGPVITTNPEPYKAFFDFMLIGDGEDTFKEILEVLKSEKNKNKCIEKLKNIEGIYFGNNKVSKITSNLNTVIYTPIITNKGYFKNTFIIETSRGCMNRCAFCTASYLNFPYRCNQYKKIMEVIDIGLKYTNKIALLGAQVASHPNFEEIMLYIKEKILQNKNIELGISSLRADAITPQIVEILRLGGQKHITIAIEAASDRLREFINKNLKEEQILDAIRVSKENGLAGIKIYSMIGIPYETHEDIQEFLVLAKKIKSENRDFQIEFSFSTFVPKPNTPFQWSKREDTKSLEKKRNFLKSELAKLGIQSKFSSPKWDYWQTVLSRGDEKISDLMINVYKAGGKIGSYKNEAKKLEIDLSKYTEDLDFNQNLFWENIITNIKKDTLINEYKRLEKFLQTDLY